MGSSSSDFGQRECKREVRKDERVFDAVVVWLSVARRRRRWSHNRDPRVETEETRWWEEEQGVGDVVEGSGRSMEDGADEM